MAALSTLALLAASAAGTYSKNTAERRAAAVAEQQGNAQAGLLTQNATMADAQAADAIARGDLGASAVARQARVTAGAQRAAFAGQGVTVDSGSAADVVGSDRALSALDQLTIKNNAKRAAWGFQTEAAGYRTEADWAKQAGANQGAALRQQANDTLLGGATQLLNTWGAAPHGVGRTPPATGIPQAAYGANDFARNYRARVTAPATAPTGYNG